MSRAWIAFAVGLVALASPLRLVWSGPGASPWWAFVVAAALLGVAAWAARGRT